MNKFVTMIRVGLIGKIDAIESMVSLMGSCPDAHVIGKASSGFLNRLESPKYSIPELSRADLVEKADALILTEGAKLSAEHLYEVIKKSKPIFTSDYLTLTPGELYEVEKLLNESNTVFQYHNPFYYHPVIQWIRHHFQVPAYFDMNYMTDSMLDRNQIVKLLMLPVGFLGVNPLKFRHTSLMSPDESPGFINIRFEYSDSSVINFNIGFRNPVKEFTIRAFSGKQNLLCNLLTGLIEYDQKTIQPEKINQFQELADFFGSVTGKTPVRTGIPQYGSILRTVAEIGRKNNWPES